MEQRKSLIDELGPIDQVELGENFENVDSEVSNRCMRVFRMYFEIDESKIDEFNKIQLNEIGDVLQSVFQEEQDPNLITPSMFETIEGIYTNQHDLSFDERIDMYKRFCDKFGIDSEVENLEEENEAE